MDDISRIQSRPPWSPMSCEHHLQHRKYQRRPWPWAASNMTARLPKQRIIHTESTFNFAHISSRYWYADLSCPNCHGRWRSAHHSAVWSWRSSAIRLVLREIDIKQTIGDCDIYGTNIRHKKFKNMIENHRKFMGEEKHIPFLDYRDLLSSFILSFRTERLGSPLLTWQKVDRFDGPVPPNG